MRAWLLVPLLSVLAACATTPPRSAASLTGTVTYRERIALPPESRLVVTISDVSLADAPSVTISQNQITTAGNQVPISFTIGYERTLIRPGRTYAVSARIFDAQGELAWITDTRTALPPEGERVELQLVQVRR